MNGCSNMRVGLLRMRPRALPHNAQSMRDSDTPRYVWCRLERTDTTDGSVKADRLRRRAAGNLDWKYPERRKVIAAQIRGISPEFKKLEADMKNWGMQVPEVIDPDYAGPWWLTWPLPPVLLHDWGRDAAHAKIPLAHRRYNRRCHRCREASRRSGSLRRSQQSCWAQALVRQDHVARREALIKCGPWNDTERRLCAAAKRSMLPAVPYKLFRFVDMDVLPSPCLSIPGTTSLEESELRPRAAVAGQARSECSDLSRNPLERKVAHRDLRARSPTRFGRH